MATFFQPRTADTLPRFERTSTSPEFQEGFLLGFLCNLKNYDLRALTGRRTDGVLIIASSSTVEPGVSPDFDYPVIRTGINNIVDLHAKTLWMGGRRISDKSGRLFSAVHSVDFDINTFGGGGYSFSCSQYVEELILRWGFAAVKDPMQSTLYIYPLFLGIDLNSDTPVDRNACDNGGNGLDGMGNAAVGGEDIWGHISRRLSENNNKIPDDFRRGFFQGINF